MGKSTDMAEKLRLIEAYIFAMKGVEVRINEPDTAVRWALFNLAYRIAMQWKGTLS
jgi:hypothetical protein